MENLILIGILCILVVSIIYMILHSPFQYPYFENDFDVSEKMQSCFEDLIDQYINSRGIRIFEKHYRKVQKWKEECQQKLNGTVLKKLRQKQFEKCLDDKNMFHFNLIRQKTVSAKYSCGFSNP